MKYLKKFEHFTGHDLGRFSDEEDHMEPETLSSEDEMDIHNMEDEMDMEEEEEDMDDETYEEEREDEKGRVWGDEVVEGKKAKPDFLDLDKDGNKKESMKKAAKDAKDSKKEDKEDKDSKKEDKKEDKSGKGLTAAQKKLPEGLRKAIEAKKKK